MNRFRNWNKTIFRDDDWLCVDFLASIQYRFNTTVYFGDSFRYVFFLALEIIVEMGKVNHR